MKNTIIAIRNYIIKFFYKLILKPIFFRHDPEDVHDHMTKMGKMLGKTAIGRGLTSLMFNYKNKTIEQNILGIHFPNPIGLSAGFDKNAELTQILPAVGFGFVEVGSITGEPCTGNPRPRLWRLKKSKALVVYYGLKNDGCEKISAKLKNLKFKIPVGISVAKTNCKETAELEPAIKDYVKAFEHFTTIGDYITINISCPNAFGGQPFTDEHKLEKLLAATDKIPYGKPIFLKLSADLTPHEIDTIIAVVQRHKVHGLICTNLTKKRDNPKIIEEVLPEVGGISGKVVEEMATKMISYVYKKTKGKFIIIGCGGVFTAEDAYKKIKAGASLIQMITGMIFEGPQVISQINLGLVNLLKKDGYKNIAEAVGADHK